MGLVFQLHLFVIQTIDIVETAGELVSPGPCETSKPLQVIIQCLCSWLDIQNN